MPLFWDIESTLINELFNATVTLSYDDVLIDALGGTETNLAALYYNESTQMFEFIPSVVDTEANTVSFETNHFSRYLLGFVEPPTLGELFSQFGVALELTSLDNKHKRFLLNYISVIEAQSLKEGSDSSESVNVLLRNVERKIQSYSDGEDVSEIEELLQIIEEIESTLI